MSLTCDCGYFSDYWYIPDKDFKPLATKRRRRCCSCHSLIDVGADSIMLDRYRCPVNDIEERIYGDEVPLAPRFLCARCGEIYLNLDALGYCYYLGDSLEENLKEYWQLTGFCKGKANEKV